MSTSEPLGLSAEQVVSRINSCIPLQDGDSAIAKMRRFSLTEIATLISAKGLQLTDDEKRECCLMPIIFQEFNYDDYGWSDRLAKLGRLEEMVEIDVLVWSGGLRRCELTDLAYEQYVRFCHDEIDRRQKRFREQKGIGLLRQKFKCNWSFERVAVSLFFIGLIGIEIFIWKNGGATMTQVSLIVGAVISFLYLIHDR